jgi:hypothetical protein
VPLALSKIAVLRPPVFSTQCPNYLPRADLRASHFRPRPASASRGSRQAEAVAGAEVEDPRIEAKKQNGKGKAEATDGGEGWESGGEDGRAAVRSGRQAVPTRKKLPVIILIAR